MKRIDLYFWGFLCAITAIWMMADTFLPEPLTYFSLRGAIVPYSGIIAISVMSVTMYLATRPRWIEPYFGGLDKMYRVHKWLGIAALSSSVLHWWWAKGTKWMVGWGWLEKPVRTPIEYTGIEAFFRSQRGNAEWIGEWCFYPAFILMVLALIKFFPYHWFKKTHKILALLYLPYIFHAIILTKFSYWTQPIGAVVIIMLCVGGWSALYVLFGHVGKKRKAQGAIDKIHAYPELNMLKVDVKMESPWPGHQSGQFTFVTFDAKEGSHPFTIASDWESSDGTLSFISKSLGDYTQTLADRLQKGSNVTVEGPYGFFDFNDGNKRQIWVAGGIGITPFIARLKQLKHAPEGQDIDLFYSTREYASDAADALKQLALDASVRLHILIDKDHGLLTPDIIREKAPGWKDASHWFCGPRPFGNALRRAFVNAGVKRQHYHQEYFSFR